MEDNTKQLFKTQLENINMPDNIKDKVFKLLIDTYNDGMLAGWFLSAEGYNAEYTVTDETPEAEIEQYLLEYN